MEVLRSMLATIRQQLSRLTVTHKLLLGSLCVIMVMVLLLVGLYAGRADWVELLKGYPAAEQTRAAAFLSTANITHKVAADGKLMVPADRVDQARAALAESGQLPNDKTLLFSNLVEKQNWINSRQQNEQIFLMALQNQLAADIANFKGVKSSTVIIDVPEIQGLGRAVRKPSAVATVMTEDGRALPQATVDAVAAYVAGSRAGLEVERVRVIDAATGRQRKATGEQELISSTYIEHAARVEAMTQEKISELLRYIPGVIVAVTAQVDVTRVESRLNSQLPAGKGSLAEVRSEKEDTTETAEGTGAAEPGLASNVAMDINRGGGAGGQTNKTSKTEREYSIIPGTKTETVLDPKGMPTMVAVSVSVPQGFVTALFKDAGAAGGTGGGAAGGAGGGNGGAGAGGGPTEQQLTERFEKEVRPRIESQIRNHVRTMTTIANAGLAPAAIDKLLGDSISVTMIPVDVPATTASVQSAGLLAGLSGGGGGSIAAGLVDKIVIGVLGVVSLGMMLTMVRKAGKKVEMPTAEEIVGLPPAVESVADVIGEADEADTAMQGIEVDDKTVQVTKMMDQVNEMISKEPDMAARLMNRWVTVND